MKVESACRKGLRQSTSDIGRICDEDLKFDIKTPRLIFNLRQAAEFLGVSERKFHELRAAGLVPPPLNLGPRVLRWFRDELIDHVLSHSPRGGCSVPAHLNDPAVIRRRQTSLALRQVQRGE